MAGQMAGRPFGSEIWWTPLEPRNHKNRSLDVDVDWAAGSAFLGGAANLWHSKKTFERHFERQFGQPGQLSSLGETIFAAKKNV